MTSAKPLGARQVVDADRRAAGVESPDSLGVYLTWDPRPGRTDAQRNCLSNIRAEGMAYELAARQLAFLMQQARLRRLSGVPYYRPRALSYPRRPGKNRLRASRAGECDRHP